MVDSGTRITIVALLILIVILYEIEPRIFRRQWQAGKSIINATSFAMAQRQDFIAMTRFDITVFLQQIVEPVRLILDFPDHVLEGWLNDEINIHRTLNARKRRTTLSTNNRIMRFMMLNANWPIKALELLFGQKKSAIHKDMHLLDRVYTKVNNTQFELPFIGSAFYQERLGMGVLGDVFPDAIGIMDGHEECVCFCVSSVCL